MRLTKLFKAFYRSEKAGGLILILSTVLSLALANSGIGQGYIHFWHTDVFHKPVELQRKQVFGTGILAGVGFYIFIVKRR